MKTEIICQSCKTVIRGAERKKIEAMEKAGFGLVHSACYLCGVHGLTEWTSCGGGSWDRDPDCECDECQRMRDEMSIDNGWTVENERNR